MIAWKKQEEELLVKLSKYPEIVREAANRYDPSVVCKYVFELSQQINDFYHQVNILKSEDKLKIQRLKLLEDCSKVLKLGLGLFGDTDYREDVKIILNFKF